MKKEDSIKGLLNFLDDSPDPFHAVNSVCRLLDQAIKLNTSESWALKPDQTYCLSKNGATVLGFKTPVKITQSSKVKFNLIAAHTDSPCLKLKPEKHKSHGNYSQWGCEVYGGVLINSWLDRDLAIAGRVSVADKSSTCSHLIQLDEHPVRIPQLAIHLDRNINEKGLKLNSQKHIIPILGLDESELLNEIFDSLKISKKKRSSSDVYFDLCLYDKTKASLGGLNQEFIYSGRLDNLAMCHASLSAFMQSQSKNDIFQVFCFFDHEEVGSMSTHGAFSAFLMTSLEKIGASFDLSRLDVSDALSRSTLISADMAHALHPNYVERHDGDHQPLIGKGPVLKFNSNQRYASTSEGGALISQLCQKAEIPLQKFVNRNDMGCGSTIGPFVASHLGIQTIDLGNAMLSMHSIREMTGTEDHPQIIKLFKEFYENV